MRRRLLTPLTAALAPLALVACSSDGTITTTQPASTETTTTPGTTTPGTTPASSAPSTNGSDSLVPTTTQPLAEGAVSLTPFVGGLTKPVDIGVRPGDSTFYVAQQDGRVVPVRDGVAGAPVIDLSSQVSTGGEQGLLGIAFHPTDPFVYLDYTNTKGDTVVAEYPVRSDGTFDTGSARTVLTVDQPYSNHNGGKLAFGPDGMLYISLGDGGKAGDPQRHALDLSSQLGKILRVDPRPSDGKPYTVPADNPFVGRSGADPTIWAYGLRNPWRFGFDSATGDLWIGDVGQNDWEEVDFAPATDGTGAGKGMNFGWSALEGTHPYNADQSAEGAVPPVHEYPHGDEGCSVSGGTVYRGSAIPSLVGWYVFSDYCSAKVWALQPDGTIVVLGKVTAVSAVSVGPDGELYVLSLGEGALYRLDPA